MQILFIEAIISIYSSNGYIKKLPGSITTRSMVVICYIIIIIREDYEYKNRWIKKIMNEMSIQYFFIIKFQVACTYCDSVIHICGTFS